MPLFILFGGELFLAVAVLGVGFWVIRGWRDFDPGPPAGPSGGPKGGLPLSSLQRVRVRGGHAAVAPPLRPIGWRRGAAPCRQVKTISA